MPNVATIELTRLAVRALARAGASDAMAQATARALVHADAQGLATHGLSRLALYCEHLRNGRANGAAVPRIVSGREGTCLIDACGGLAYEALALAVSEVIERARRAGVAFCGVTNSHHSGAMGDHLRPVAAAGLVGLAFTNSPAAINAWGGKRALFGTNPVAAAFPRRDAEPIIVDLSLTEVVRGKIMLYAKEGRPLPAGWALDKDGNPTTDAQAALTGSLFAIGGAKGAMLALVVELLCCSLSGAAFGFENDSYFEPGNKPRIGHALLAIDPGALAGREVFLERVETLVGAMLADEGVRLPGDRRHTALRRSGSDGIEVPEALHRQLCELAQA
jgi:(2R)-3-sulfolactate dehydrogenase (NADP+)